VKLIDNANLYSSKEQPIIITAELSGDYVTTSVADRGPGIDDLEQGMIFDKFYRGKDQRYLCAEREWAADRQGPRHSAQGNSWSDQPTRSWLGLLVFLARCTKGGAINMNDASILVADDEPQIRRVLRSTLSSQGYVIIEAKSGEEAVEAVRKEKPDLVLLDVNMPGIGGLEACREIRQSSMLPLLCSRFETRSGTKCSHSTPERTIMWLSPLASKNCWREFVPH